MSCVGGGSLANEGDIDETVLCERAVAGDEVALSELLHRHRSKLRRLIRLRMSPQLRVREDESDIVQQSLADAAASIRRFQPDPDRPFYLWLRHIAITKLNEAVRRHVTTQKREVGREISLHSRQPEASTDSIADILIEQASTGSQNAIRAEQRHMVHMGLDAMDPVDREVLVLRHFESLNTLQTAEVLGLSKSGAGKRYLKALERLREILVEVGVRLEF